MLDLLIKIKFPQTHTKASKKNIPSQALRSPEEILIGLEPPPYGTSHAVCNCCSLFFLFLLIFLMLSLLR